MTQPVEQVAQQHYAEQATLTAWVGTQVSTAWSTLDLSDLTGSWTSGVGARILALVAGGQNLAAGRAEPYVAAALAAQKMDAEAEGEVVPAALTGVASDGRPLASLLYEPVISTKQAIGRGVPADQAFASGRVQLDMIARTQVADAGRAADGVAITARPRVDGYVRMLNPPSCSRCTVLAGRWYRWNAGFARHPRCLPAGVVVSGPRTLAATRRWYQGELVVISTAGGQELSVTGNHPVLTDRGWVPAHLIQEGDYVVRSTTSKGAVALVVPGEDQVPTLIEDVWRANGMLPIGQMPTAAEDFHGDGGHGEVNVVLADRLLWCGDVPAISEPSAQRDLSWGAQIPPLLAQGCFCGQEFGRVPAASISVNEGRLLDQRFAVAFPGSLPFQFRRYSPSRLTPSLMGGGQLSGTLLGCHLAGAYFSRGGTTADFNARRFKVPADGASEHTVSMRETVLTLAGSVRAREFVNGQQVDAQRWDPPPGPFTEQSRVAYAACGRDLLGRLAGQVELDRVIELRRVEWSGHVYNLMSTEGWFAAAGLIVSNCDCIAVPAAEDAAGDLRTDPKLYFDSLTEPEQDRIFTKAGAEAIRHGADVAKVVNARRGALGLTPAGARITNAEADALRGGRQRGRLQRDASGLYTTTEGAKGRGRKQQVRLMPESILEIANGDRAEAIRLLRLHGYLK